MRTLISAVFFLVITSRSMAQVDPNTDMTKPLTDLEMGENYLQKGRTQIKNGWIMLGLGLTMGTTGAVIASKGSFGGEAEGGAGLFLAGAASTLISIPLFISGGRNKHKAKIILSRNKVPISLGPGADKMIYSVGVRTLINE